MSEGVNRKWTRTLLQLRLNPTAFLPGCTPGCFRNGMNVHRREKKSEFGARVRTLPLCLIRESGAGRQSRKESKQSHVITLGFHDEMNECCDRTHGGSGLDGETCQTVDNCLNREKRAHAVVTSNQIFFCGRAHSKVSLISSQSTKWLLQSG